MEMLSRASLQSNCIYLCYNALAVFLYVGRSASPDLLRALFTTHDLNQVDLNRGED